MVDRQKVEAILLRRFPGAPYQQVAAAANALMGLGEEWEEIMDDEHYCGYHAPGSCGSSCYLARELSENSEFRLFRRREEAYR